MNPLQGFSIGEKVLVTTSQWFYAPDGKNYRAVYGTLHAIQSAEQTLGIKPRQTSTNWYAQIGSLLVAGCQIHYAVRAPECELGPVKSWNEEKGEVTEYMRPTVIFNADGAP